MDQDSGVLQTRYRTDQDLKFQMNRFRTSRLLQVCYTLRTTSRLRSNGGAVEGHEGKLVFGVLGKRQAPAVLMVGRLQSGQ